MFFLADNYFEPQSSPFDDFLAKPDVREQLQPHGPGNVLGNTKGMIYKYSVKYCKIFKELLINHVNTWNLRLLSSIRLKL